MKIKNFKEAEEYLKLHITNGSRQIFEGKFGLEKQRYLLELMGSPQNKLKVIHVAGTAGKGSTCYFVSSLLTAHGLKTGMHLSPHLKDVRERFQIDGKIITEGDFVKCLNEIIPYVEKVENSKYGHLSYFAILIALAYHIFWKYKVDYAVIETGLGGLYDASNVVERNNKLSVITKIGYDHMGILGNSINEIAFQKAAIINYGSQAVSTIQVKEAETVIRRVASERGSKLNFAKSKYAGKIGLKGEHQRENAGLALRALELLAFRDGFELEPRRVAAVFADADFPGRFEIRKIGERTVVLDGAHSQPKMEALAKALKSEYPDEKFDFLVAFKKGKDYKKMLDYIVPLAKSITVTSFFTDNQDLYHLSEKPVYLARELDKASFGNYEVIPEPGEALEQVLKNSDGKIVITGSLYLLGEIYKKMSNFK